MAIRHRIPSVFNVAMVDVLCCALGCVILMWLLNSRDARSRAKEAGVTRSLLKDSRARLSRLKKDFSTLQSRYAVAESNLTSLNAAKRQLETDIVDLKSTNTAAQTSIAKLTKEQRDLLKALAALKLARDEDADKLRKKTLTLRELEKALAALKTLQSETAAKLALRLSEKNKLAEEINSWKKKQAGTEASLVKLTQAQRDLLKELASLKALRTEDRDDLRKKALELRDLEKALAVLRSQKTDMEKRLRTADGRIRLLESDLSDRKKELSLADNKLAVARGKLLRQLEQAQLRIDDLSRAKNALEGRVQLALGAAARRFAGVALTGKRVVFLVDRSGSMKRIDKKTPAPQKWEEVRNTLAKVMRSLPGLEKFQVILFSNKATYLLGDSDHWIDFDPKTSVDRVIKALTEIKPLKGTDMHAGFKEAFRFRTLGLDTIYVLSDGLPNMGEGLTAREARRLQVRKHAEILSKYIRNKLQTRWNPPGTNNRVQIHTIGFFYESPDVGSFLWALARENDGSFVGMSKP
jgi:hypothetical protein